MKDLQNKKRKKMIKEMKKNVLADEKFDSKYRDFMEEQKALAKKSPVTWKIEDTKTSDCIKTGGIQKTFTSLEVCNLMLASLGVKPTEYRDFNVSWKFMPDTKDNTITVTEIVRKDVEQKQKREWNLFEAFLVFLLAVYIGVSIIDIVVTKEKIEVEKLSTCELRGDCSEVIRDINK